MRRAAFILTLGLLLLGCGSKEPVLPEEESLKGIPTNAPAWVANPSGPDKLAAVGGSPQVTGGLRFQQIEATGRAKEALRERIEQLGTQAALVVLQRLSQAGLPLDTVEKDARTLGLMLGAKAATEFTREAIWWSPAREHYVLLAIARPRLRTLATETFSLYIRSKAPYRDRLKRLNDPDFIRMAVEQTFDLEGTGVAQ